MSVHPIRESLEVAARPDRKPGHFDNRELSTIAVLATLHFGVSLASRLFGYVLYAFLGPFYVFLSGLGDEAVPSLLLAVAVVLVPRIGTVSLSIATVWLLNVLVTGTLSLASILMVSMSLIVYEIVLGATGITLESRVAEPRRQAPLGLVMRIALALGAANALALYIQFLLSIYLYQWQFAWWYVHAVALATGLGYGAIGAAVGAIWGFRLRRAAP